MPEFTVKVDQNRYLPEGGREVHAIVTVEASGSGVGPVGGAPGDPAAEVIIIDTSGSMSFGGKMAEAKRAAKAAVDALRDGVHFAVVAGFNFARPVYPKGETMAVADARTKEEAKREIGRLEAAGGTAIGSWLRMAGKMMAAQGGGGVRHAILLTDGKNQHETDAELDVALAEVNGGFVCDCRGVGTDWEVGELRKIASTLLGSVDIVADPRDLEADFRAMTENAMGKSVADVALRVWTPQHGVLKFVKQVSPSLADLTDKRTESGPQSGDYPTGAWGDEVRDYHLCVQVPPGEVGRQMRAAWVKLVAPDGAGGEQVLASGNVLAEWTDDEARSTQINARVAGYTGQAELAEAIQEGLAARREGDLDTATARLGRAVVLARQAGNQQIAGLLDKVVDVIDPVTGTVRLKKDVDKADEMSLDTRSTKTVRTRKDGG
ncbi:von Willebrand factor type A domain-containing protein [Thermomonospora echinospora]|uniref:von Willebrand factor type A domain-containing protein n=1 Tax=Thermomonospora echinospora TaxID=1992 RepID=A0A1H6DX81_9ACTN|nr:VWA domain-containing protein [Thermomonospora echinospora]SEG89809.1 von Willebrand factor type A domain-containing protein [Thermomonospora echinospora]